jgi:glutaredoxin
MVQDSLDEVAVTYQTVFVPEHGASDRLPGGTQVPVLVDDDKVIEGNTNIYAYIEDLWRLRADWLKYQSDTCYID